MLKNILTESASIIQSNEEFSVDGDYGICIENHGQSLIRYGHKGMEMMEIYPKTQREIGLVPEHELEGRRSIVFEGEGENKALVVSYKSTQKNVVNRKNC
ncbi:hypothetical protein [Aureibacter tunicatorum]|uniref:Uncharacterized protein n=1 Tax=Aureibacter tunicatorum TaxID=866807 RepID=A0AAE3XQX8_9BACT|nr:hypothetical protein [Aureibacter tunicatorum]MDR6240967.1 hypothetical protein [Aureibacter tunicatorum]BDD03747.1 hypothetical protein AUTU_12300 [Aureibacter tunicatorum]